MRRPDRSRSCWDVLVVALGSSDGGSRLRRLYERSLNPPLATGSTLLHVRPDADGSWVVTEPGAARPLRHLPSREQALALVTTTLREARGGHVEIIEEDGSTELVAVTKGKRPWWQMTRSPLGGLVLGLVWLGLFVIRAVDSRWPPGWSYDTFALVLTGLCAALLLLSTARRMIRRRPPARDATSPPQRPDLG